jgi:hypothetical protein
VEPVAVGEGAPTAQGLGLAAGLQMGVDDPEIERDVLKREVTIPMRQDEGTELIGVDQDVLVARAGRGQGERGDLAVLDDGGLGVEGERLPR